MTASDGAGPDREGARYALVDGDGGQWLVQELDHCTCSPHYGAHEPGCGYDPVARISEVVAALTAPAEGVEVREEARPNPLADVLRADRMVSEMGWPADEAGRLTIDALMQRHWLVFGTDGKHVVAGCNCGFRADLDADFGYGDSVVRHLLEVGRACPPADGVEVREEWGVRRIDGRERLWTCDDERDAQSWVSDNNATSSKPRLEVVHHTVTTTRWEPQP